MEIEKSTSKISEEVGKNLLSNRESIGMSRKELSDRSGISSTYISQIENSRLSNISLNTIQRLVDAMGISIVIAMVPFEKE